MQNNERKSFRICFVGPSGSGKTSIAKQLVSGIFDPSQSSTVGVELFSFNFSSNISVYVWDTSGVMKYRSVIIPYMQTADLVVFIFDLSNPHSIHDIKDFKVEGNYRCILIGNKSDLTHAITREGRDLANEWNCEYAEISAKERVQVKSLIIDQCINKFACQKIDPQIVTK